MAQIAAQMVPLRVSDGTNMNAFLARPSKEGKHPGMLVFQEAFGVNGHIRDICQRMEARRARWGLGFSAAQTTCTPSLLFWGGRDGHIGTDQTRAVTDALRDAGKTYINVEFSDADHGFFCDARPSYHPASAAQAWALCRAFLKEQLAS
jgi:dienelactone hydrolase